MPSPVLPSDFQSCISNPASTLCGNFVNTLLKLPSLVYQLVNYLFDSSGDPSKAFVNQALPTGSLLFSAVLLSEDGTKLLCDGRTFATATYPDLSTALGTIYGTASAGNFVIPDYRARFPVGLGSGGTSTFAGGGTASVGVAAGEDLHKLTAAELFPHVHKVVNDGVNGSVVGSVLGTRTANFNQPGIGPMVSLDGTQDPLRTDTGGCGDPTSGTPPTAATGHNTVPPYLPCYVYIIT